MEVLVNNDIDNVEGEKVAIITGDIPILCMCVSRCCLFCVCVQYPGDYVNQISFFNMSMRDPPGRTYKFYTGTPVFEFGHGLSYTTFSFVW